MATKAILMCLATAMWAAPLILLTGCGSSLPPFVQTIGAYKPNLNSEKTITTIEVCYNKLTSTPEAVKQLAENACIEEGTQAVFHDQRILQCPLLYPVSAIFQCR
jgi:hypothetical protein